jgi:PAS domain S-box-containing protein
MAGTTEISGAALQRRHAERLASGHFRPSLPPGVVDPQNVCGLLDLLLRVTTEGIFGVDSHDCCVFVNDAALSMLGYPLDRLLGERILDVIEVPGEESRFLRADGSCFPVRVFSCPWPYFTAVPDQESGTVYVFQDLTETARVEGEMRELSRRHRELFDYVITGVYQTSPEGELLAVNPALIELLGFDSEHDLRAIDVAQLYVEPEQRKAMLARLERDGVLRNVILTLRRKDGQIIQLVENARAVRASDGRMTYFEGTLNPIGQRYWAQSED